MSSFHPSQHMKRAKTDLTKIESNITWFTHNISLSRLPGLKCNYIETNQQTKEVILLRNSLNDPRSHCFRVICSTEEESWNTEVRRGCEGSLEAGGPNGDWGDREEETLKLKPHMPIGHHWVCGRGEGWASKQAKQAGMVRTGAMPNRRLNRLLSLSVHMTQRLPELLKAFCFRFF